MGWSERYKARGTKARANLVAGERTQKIGDMETGCILSGRSPRVWRWHQIAIFSARAPHNAAAPDECESFHSFSES